MKTRAAVLYERGKPTPYAASRPLVIEDVELEGPGQGEVLVEIAAAGLCHSDLSTINGSRPRPLPIILGHEAAGIVRDTGSGVTTLKPGDHVVFSFVPVCGHCPQCATGRAQLCENGAASNLAGSLLSGQRRFSRTTGDRGTIHHHLGVSAFSRFTVAAVESLVKVEASVPLDTAVLFGCAVMTGVGAVVNTARVQAGTSVAVFGLGGVGLAAVMGAKAAGAWPIIAVDRLDTKLELAKRCGATHTINASQGDTVAVLRELTRGGVETAIEAVGSEKVLVQAYTATRRGGTTITIGLPDPSKMLSIPAVTISAEERTLKGSFMGSCVPARDIPRFLQMHHAGLLPVDLLRSRTLALDEINEGFDALDRAEVARQIVTKF